MQQRRSLREHQILKNSHQDENKPTFSICNFTDCPIAFMRF